MLAAVLRSGATPEARAINENEEEVNKLSKMTLKAARVNAGLTQEAAAKELGITADTLRRYEKAESFPDVPVIQKIEALYSVTYDQLVFLPENYGLTVSKEESR